MRRFTWPENAVFDAQAGLAEDPVVEPAPVVHHDDDSAARPQGATGSLEHRGDALAVPSTPFPISTSSLRSGPEQLEGICVLLVVVDQPRVRRRGQHEVDRELEHTRVAVEDDGVASRRLAA